MSVPSPSCPPVLQLFWPFSGEVELFLSIAIPYFPKPPPPVQSSPSPPVASSFSCQDSRPFFPPFDGDPSFFLTSSLFLLVSKRYFDGRRLAALFPFFANIYVFRSAFSVFLVSILVLLPLIKRVLPETPSRHLSFSSASPRFPFSLHFAFNQKVIPPPLPLEQSPCGF